MGCASPQKNPEIICPSLPKVIIPQKPETSEIKGGFPVPGGSEIKFPSEKIFKVPKGGGAYLPKSAVVDFDFEKRKLEYYIDGVVSQVDKFNTDVQKLNDEMDRKRKPQAEPPKKRFYFF